jgi:putative hydrolase of the HAD superfamily
MSSELRSDSLVSPPVSLTWAALDIVLLDMDGTLLDLRFDNYFWRELVPERYAERRRMTTAQAVAELVPRFAAAEGTLDWYCTDYWSRELGLDIAGLKHEARRHIRFLPGAEAFLRWLEGHSAKVVLITNAHHDSLRIKAAHTGLDAHFDALVSSHSYGVPKEHEKFWLELEREIPFARERSLFIDDSVPVLRAARRHGIAHIIAVARPDSTAARREVDEFQVVEGVADLIR